MRFCQFIAEPKCSRAAQIILQSPTGDIDMCLTHHRILTVGEFGQKANPPWTKDRALDALINQDGFSAEDAEKRVNDFFERDQK